MTSQDLRRNAEVPAWTVTVEDDADTAAAAPPAGYHPVGHGFETGVHCGRAGEGLLSLAITITVFVEAGWPLRSPYTHVPVSFWLDDGAGTLAIIRDPLGESLWRTASSSYGEPLFANQQLPFSHPILARVPWEQGGMLVKVPHQARAGVLYLDIGGILLPELEPDTLQLDADDLVFHAELLRQLGLPVDDHAASGDPALPVLSDIECAALHDCLAPERLGKLGWVIEPDGSVIDGSGTSVLPPGFADALRKLLAGVHTAANDDPGQ